MAKKKQAGKKQKAKKETSIMVVSQDATKPIEGRGGALSMQKTWIQKDQLVQMLQRTPEQHVHTRPAKGGGEWDYVTGVYVTKVLNYVFGWNWDFEIKDQREFNVGKDDGQVITTGRLIVRNKKGDQQIVKTQIGRADIKYKKGTKICLDLGNDYKASATDALKKCASMFGIASDVYGKEEFKEIGVAVRNGNTTADIKVKEVKSSKKIIATMEQKEPDHSCRECGNPMTNEEAAFSKKMFHNKKLCRGCQGLYKKNKW